VTVNLLAAGGGPVDATNTAPNGLYQFTSLTDGGYSIEVGTSGWLRIHFKG
jgi:hypothetical protein